MNRRLPWGWHPASVILVLVNIIIVVINLHHNLAPHMGVRYNRGRSSKGSFDGVSTDTDAAVAAH